MDSVILTAALLIAFLWGFQSILQKQIMVEAGVSAEDFVVMSGACYAVVIGLYYFFVQKRHTKLDCVDLHYFFYTMLFTTLFIFLPNVLFLWCISRTSPLTVLGITLLSPLFTLLVGCSCFGLQVTSSQIAGLLVMVCGAVLMNR